MNMVENICCFFLSYLKKKSKTIMSFSTINHFKNIISRNNTYHKVYNLSPCFQAYMKLKDLICIPLPSYTTINSMILRPECLGAIFNFCSKGQLISKQNCRAVTSPKKRTNEQICFSILTTRKYLKLEIEIQVSSISELSG